MTNTNTAEQTYLYSVHPRTVIKELPVAPIRVPKSLYLTKDQVLICLKHGAVYRRFANEGKNERVTITNVDRLHNEKFMTEEQYAAFLQSGVADNRGTTIGDTTVTPDKEPEKEPEVEPVKENESVETTETEKSEDNTPEQTAEPAAENEEATETTEEEDECAACNIDYSQLESTETTEEETVEESTEQEVEDESASESVEAVVEQANSNSQQTYNNGKNKHGKNHR